MFFNYCGSAEKRHDGVAEPAGNVCVTGSDKMEKKTKKQINNKVKRKPSSRSLTQMAARLHDSKQNKTEMPMDLFW